MTVKDICQVHYFSCVEAYFGAWIKKFVPLPMLYCESFLSWHEICKAFSNGATYADFNLIRRIQDMAEAAGLVTHEKLRGMTDYMPNEKNLILVSVNEKFFPKQKPWRKDHYIAIEKITPTKIDYVNEYPLLVGEMPLTAFREKFGGDSLIYKLCSQDNLFCRQQSAVQANELKTFSVGDIDTFPLLALRDALGILRVSRKRILEWLAWYSDISGLHQAERLPVCIKEQIQAADKYYLQAQSMFLRKKSDDSIIQRIIADIRQKEEKIKLFAKEEL